MNSYDFRKHIRHTTSLLFGREPVIHRIPFGPNRGRKIYLSFDISARMYLGFDEPWVASLARKFIKPGDVVFDLGAHVGYTTILFAQYTAPEGCVHAFELVPSVAEEFLSRTVAANDFRNIVIHKVGLSDKEEAVTLSVGDTMMGSIFALDGGGDAEVCRLVTLDKYVAEQGIPFPALIKIDIECAEIQCLLGSSEILKKHSPILIIEFHSLELLEKGVSLLQPMGYTLSTKHSTVTTDFFQKRQHFHNNVLCLPSSLCT
jgi:FkbM family methyltransferase